MDLRLFFLPRRALGIAVVALFAIAGKVLAQTTLLYDATNSTRATQPGTLHYLQYLSPAQGPGTYVVNSFEFSVNFNTNLANQGVVITFYSGANLSPTATNALAGASNLGSASFSLDAQSTTGSFRFLLIPPTPLSLNLSTGAVAVEFRLTNDTYSAYSTELSGNFSTAAPVVGSAPGFVWNDANLDGVFTGAEQTTFGQPGGAYVRFSLTGALVPEPGTWALMAGGLGTLAMIGRRRRVGGQTKRPARIT